MTSTQTASFVAMITALVLIYLLVIIGVPRLTRLLFRHRLEVIRDECMDEILDGHLHETRSVRRFLRAIETATAISRHLTLARLFALTQAMVDEGVVPERVIPPGSYADLEPAERQIMLRLDDRLCRAYESYLNWGSPTGWASRPLVSLVGRIRPRGSTAKAKEALPVVARKRLQDPTAKPSSALPSARHLFAGR